MAFVKQVSSISWSVLAFSFLTHASTVVQWRVFSGDYSPFVSFPAFFFLVVFVSFALSVAALSVAEPRWFRILLCGRLMCVLFVLSTFAHKTHIWLPMVLVAFIEISIYERYPVNIAFSTIVSVIGIAVWTMSGLSQDVYRFTGNVLTLVFAGAPVMLCGSLMTRYRQEHIDLIRQVHRLNGAVTQLATANKLAVRHASSARERSSREERDRITRDLHDTIGYTLTNLIMMMHSASALIEVYPSKLRSILDSAREQASHGLDEARRALYNLRERDNPDAKGILAIHRLMKSFGSAAEIEIEANYCNAPLSFSDQVNDVLLHLVEEGLTNALRHGKAEKIRLDLWVDTETLHVTLWDNGKGAEDINEGIGIRGMRERLGKLGGTIEVGNHSSGFQLRAEIPL